MASLQAIADSVRAAVLSTITCNPATVTTLNDLLIPKSSSSETNTSRPTIKTATGVRGKIGSGTTAKKRGRKVSFVDESVHGDQLSAKERSILATEVINATLKALSEAIKAPPPRKKDSSKDLVKASARKVLRRSNSMPQTPLQPRSLSRVSSSPNISTRHSRSISSTSTPFSGSRSTAECARVAFACLRALQAGKIPGIDLPPLQLENGMSVLIAKLVALGLDDLAIKELRILKRRLDPEDGRKKRAGNATTAPQTLDELLEFGKGSFIESKLGLIITTQLQVLRLLASSRKYRQIECIIPILQPSHPSSPTSLLLSAARGTSKPEKYIRQLQSLSDILLSLGPSISISDDPIALEQRLSVPPEVALQLQSLALCNRTLWWQLASHTGDTTKELFDPFLRCLSAFARRTKADAEESYHLAFETFREMQSCVSNLGKSETWPIPALKGTYRILSSLAQEAHHFDSAINWARKIKELMDVRSDSAAKRCCVDARIVGLTLQTSPNQAQNEEELLALLGELEKPFKGESSEIDDLMTEVSSARRAAITFLANKNVMQGQEDATEGIREMCESLVLICPRLCLRYLGSSPSEGSATKDIVRREQRRRFIYKSANNAVDSVLYLIRTMLASGSMNWELMDSKLQDCLSLLERLETVAEITPDPAVLPLSYFVKISNLYFSHYLNLQRDCSGSKDEQMIRILRRSLECVRSRPQQEKKAALFSTKLERIAEIFKDTGRYDELFKILLILRDEIIESGALSAVAANASTMRLQAAWTATDEISSLARTMRSLLKVHYKSPSPTQMVSLLKGDWTTDERATMIEQYLEMLTSQTESAGVAGAFRTKIFEALLSIYNRREYPIRRLRVLLRLISLDSGLRSDIVDDLGAEIDALRSDALDIESSKDVGLRGYYIHLRTFARSMLTLEQEQSNIDVLKEGLLEWSSIRSRSEDLEALESQVDDVKGLRAHLQSIADYAQLMGSASIRLASLQLYADYTEFYPESCNDLIGGFSRIALQWLHLGYSGKAGLLLDKAQNLLHRNGVNSATLLQLHISHSQYMFEIGNYDKSDEYLLRARANFQTEPDLESSRPMPVHQRIEEKCIVSDAYLLQSKLALERGFPQTALVYAKQSLNLLRRVWVNIQEQQKRQLSRSSMASELTTTDKLADETANLSISTIGNSATNEHQWLSGSGFWHLITPLFRAMSWLSTLHAHHGMFQETVYYAEQGYKLVQQAGARGHTATASASLGSIFLKAGRLDKGSELLNFAQQHRMCGDESRESAVLSCHLGKMHGLLGDPDAEMDAYIRAQSILSTLIKPSFINSIGCLMPADDLDNKMATLTIRKTKAVVPRKGVARSKVIPQKKITTRENKPIEISSSVAEECPQLLALNAVVLRQRAQVLGSAKKFADALAILDKTSGCSHSQMSVIEQGLAMAKHLLLQSIEQMHADPVYSVLQESTISFPSIAGLFKSERYSVDKLSITKTSPPARRMTITKGRRDLSRSKSPAPNSFFDKLRQAQDHLTEVYATASSIAPINVVHTMSSILNSVAILLSASGQVKGKLLAHPGFASCSIGKSDVFNYQTHMLNVIEMARSMALRRERKVIMTDSPNSKTSLDWPEPVPSESRRSSLSSIVDMSRFQKEYVDIIPKTWTAISIALSETRNELSITKLETGHSPFVLRLPLGRNNSIDADEEVFGFEQGHSEMLEIIELADETARGSGEVTGREAKNAWWEKRTALDSRLRDLLENIEKVWLGGFTGIFSQHSRKSDLLARFQKSFQNILDKYLPSRQKTKRSTIPRINLDSRILDLFIGLGDASDDDCEFSEPLTDLLYFVVDVYQFHGELNAYAEIDFDSIVVETHDALRGYHAAVRASYSSDEGRHTILILDKALHMFPWESLPCMSGLAVSRLPSLSCLRDRVLEQQEDIPKDSIAGHYVDRDNGSYILNPQGDLKNTQATFEKTLQSLQDWNSVVGRAPEEEEFKSYLESKDIMLYFGHGSGAQFIRAREIRKLEKCAVTLLMGCSSGALTETGEFEPFGPPINYMHAGSPALVATLWDVTDKDIDRFFQNTFEKWGLLERPEEKCTRKGKGKEKKKVDVVREEKKTSLVEAVAGSRKACILPFLNAAAVVVYGVPVYIK